MGNKNKYICLHGHFYQPPRENAWLEAIEKQDSAAPFHDWNERINFECYAPNTAARIQQGNEIINIVNNYQQISFNFGPTLLSWMEKEDRHTYESIIKADYMSRKRFSGHGCGIAQVYNHIILPLANDRDKDTQVIWGIKDFEYRFGRKPKGMWLAETAADLASLEALAKHDIEFTILAPRQAKAIRKIGTEKWHNLGHAEIDPRRPYLCKLPSGKSIALFFYDGNIAQDVAFKGILNNGKNFANRILDTFDDSDEPQLAHVATDGESYGHHHRHGEMALAYCLNYIEEQGLATITNYGEYLEKFPPKYEVQVHESSSWSCVHGVERWRSNCGCRADTTNGWSQSWRKPLRELLDWLRDALIPIYDVEASNLIHKPWEARNEYINVILNRSDENINSFLERYATKQLDDHQVSKVFRLLEMQRNAMLMFTSCAWFFDEISGLETNQVLQYALRTIYYARQVSGVDLLLEFEQRLESIPSNVYENGAISYREVIIPTRLDLERVGMHYACASLFETNPDDLSLFNYKVENEFFERIIAGNYRLVIGRTTVKSKITLSRKAFSFAVIYLGQQNIIGNLSTKMPGALFKEMHQQISTTFRQTDLGKVIGLMQTYFNSDKFSIWHLFRDEKRKIFQMINKRSLEQIEKNFREIYNDNYQLMTGMKDSNIPIPDVYKSALQYIINMDLHQFFDATILNIRELKRLSKELNKWNLSIINPKTLRLSAGERLFYEMKKLEHASIPQNQLQSLVDILEILQEMNLELDIWKSQNFYFSLLKKYQQEPNSFISDEWKVTFLKLGKLLNIRTPNMTSIGKESLMLEKSADSL